MRYVLYRCWKLKLRYTQQKKQLAFQTKISQIMIYAKKLSDLLFMQIEYWHYSKFKKQRYKNTAICRYFDIA